MQFHHDELPSPELEISEPGTKMSFLFTRSLLHVALENQLSCLNILNPARMHVLTPFSTTVYSEALARTVKQDNITCIRIGKKELKPCLLVNETVLYRKAGAQPPKPYRYQPVQQEQYTKTTCFCRVRRSQPNSKTRAEETT